MNELYLDGFLRPKNREYLQVLGVDEVGRGPLAGPVVGTSVAIEGEWIDIKSICLNLKNLNVTDSKKLTPKKRLEILGKLGIEVNELRANQRYEVEAFKKCKLSFSISEISNTIIDEINILQASLLSMKESIETVTQGQGTWLALIDGNQRIVNLNNHYQQQCVVKGDSKVILIALASIIAKEYRDNLMSIYSEKYPGYGLEKHAGYPTPTHKEFIRLNGPTPIHRKSFKGVKEYSGFYQ
ncbi:MAG: ribonuclease HII [Halobacteriovoraceae bacterium]|nr:ribonuclease HII [Halobacteriovoraceae bacterium]